MSDKGEKLVEIIKSYNPENIEKKESPFIKLFGKDILLEIQSEIKGGNQEKDKREIIKLIFDAISQRIRELLRADNFSLLTGAGSSVNLGGVLFSKKELENGWVANIFETSDNEKYKEDYRSLLQFYEECVEDKNYGVEDFITFLVKLEFSVLRGGVIERKKKIVTANITQIKKLILAELVNNCILPKKDQEKNLQDTKIFIKRILSRPLNLRRTNLFTTNYDLVFEKAMDDLGVIYVDGFIGGLKRYFHPEAFNFDYYYPATTTEGKVCRLERVLHLYKLHGSVNWVVSKENSFMNIYGIEKTPEEINPTSNKEILIYPTPMKECETLGFPYSEIFRKFANTIQQPQSVLITYGYSFGDAHINRIIFEALSIPSFQLVIISYSWSENIKKIYDKFKNEPSVGFIIGEYFADWHTFTNHILPDLPSQDLEEKYQQKREKAQSLIAEICKKGRGENNG